MSAFEKTVEEAVALRNGGKGTNVLIAAKLYDAGGGSVEKMTEDWGLDAEESALLLAEVKRGWKDGRWSERRTQVERRSP